MTSTSTAAAEMHEVRATLGRREVGPYDLRVAPGEVVCLVGPNGAGKTTGLHLLLGLRRRRAGHVAIAGRPVDQRNPPQGAGVSLLDDGIVPWSSARAHLEVLRPLRPGRPGPVEALELVGLGEAIDQPAGTFSAGMVRRLGLARALLGSPRLLVLDEPTASLDDAAGAWLADLVRERADEGVGILIASHDPALAALLEPRVVRVERCHTA